MIGPEALHSSFSYSNIKLPPRLIEAIIFLRGYGEGQKWLDALPRRVMSFSRLWNLTPLSVADGGAMSCCVFCEDAKGQQVVLKIPLMFNLDAKNHQHLIFFHKMERVLK